MTADEAPAEPSGESQAPLDMGPVAAGQDNAAAERFAGGVKRAIHRRLFGASIVEFCIIGPGIVAVGLLIGVAGSWIGRRRGPERKGEDQ